MSVIPMEIKVTVTQANNSYTWTYEPPKNPNNVIEQLAPGKYQITFSLESNCGAVWATDTGWIQWTSVNGAPPNGTPPGVIVQSPNGNMTEAVLHVDNTLYQSQTPETYAFKLTVVTSNAEPVTSPDPDIVLDPP